MLVAGIAMSFAVVMVTRQAEGADADILVSLVSRLQKSRGYAPPKIVVNSQQSAVAREFLLKFLLKYHINDIADIIFVVGGEKLTYDRRGHGLTRNISWVSVEYNAIDFNGLIWASENLGKEDWFLYVHDTIRLGDKFRGIFQGLPSATKPMLRVASMNIGTYVVRDLKRTKIKGKLLEFKYSQEPIVVKKKRAILEEDVIFKMLGSSPISGNDTRYVVAGPKDVYGTGTLRITE